MKACLEELRNLLKGSAALHDHSSLSGPSNLFILDDEEEGWLLSNEIRLVPKGRPEQLAEDAGEDKGNTAQGVKEKGSAFKEARLRVKVPWCLRTVPLGVYVQPRAREPGCAGDGK